MTTPTRTPVTSSHIELDERGVAWVTDTNTKVREIVIDWLSWGRTPDRIHEDYPDLPLEKIHAAFTYYYEHRDTVDAEIAAAEAFVDELMAESRDDNLAFSLMLRARADTA